MPQPPHHPRPRAAGTPCRAARLTAMADRGASAVELLEMLLSSCEDAAVGPALAAAALSVTDSKAPPHEGQPLHRSTHPRHATSRPPTPPRLIDPNAQTEPEPALRRSLVAAERLGLVLARYVLRLHPPSHGTPRLGHPRARTRPHRAPE